MYLHIILTSGRSEEVPLTLNMAMVALILCPQTIVVETTWWIGSRTLIISFIRLRWISSVRLGGIH